MISVGITGGIGSGKSLVCRIFSLLGAPVYAADKRASEIMETDNEVIGALTGILGEQVYTGNTLNRKVMADMIFKDKQLLNRVNGIVHPAVIRDFMQWREKQKGKEYVIHEAAILFESGVSSLMDVMVTVYAPVDMRIRRVKDRDGLSEAEIKSRMQRQWKEKQRQEKADFVIRNDEKHMLIPEILSLHTSFSEPSGKRI